MARNTWINLVLVCCLSGVGCGDSDAEPTMDPPTPDSGPSEPPAQGVDSGAAPASGLMAGEVCQGGDDCHSALRCVNGLPGLPSVCARPCESMDDCNADQDEQCISYSGQTQDNHCSVEQSANFAECGLGVQRHCEMPRTCIQDPTGLGLCLQLCELPGSDSDAGTDDDAGVSDDDQCPDDEICMADVLTSDEFGACAVPADLGDDCGIELGNICTDGAICVPGVAVGVATCELNCTDSGSCPDGAGTCTPIGTLPDGSTVSVCQ